ncbi:phosphatidate cytidylyltransferase [Pseudohoeflea sp. DP4N28-3]|uniref:Phosphatidate cytidylyltransferase n=1 Tax=Pseudohoeflea coraliihabitans TaxID=2860393 RepID=A0ABS6WRA6_9HYPH|nr:phosphatidate cytidylyltransferase [Pseudohoeflea sp. DP4N28-3]
MRSELGLRVISAIVLAVPVLALTWAGDLWFRALAALLALLIYYEFAAIAALRHRQLVGWALGWGATALAAALLAWGAFFQAFGAVALAAAIALGIALVKRQAPWTATAIFYAGLFALALAALRGSGAAGLIVLVFILAIVWATDILAYFCGRALGGPKLAPAISPGKTWSGALCGALAGVIAGSAIALALGISFTVTLPLVALILSIASQIGDLFESWVKRRFGAKDSSRLIPGHGGVMDRVDGLVFAVFAAFILTMLMPSAEQGAGGGEFAARLLGQ